jgi:hypothetical protein
MTRRGWHTAFVLLLATPPSMARALGRALPGIPFADVIIRGRRTGMERRYLLSILQSEGRWYVGNPHGRGQWTRNLAAAGEAIVIRRDVRIACRAIELSDGPERDAAIRATDQQPFPANLLYRAGREHVEANGRYFRLEPKDEHAE